MLFILLNPMLFYQFRKSEYVVLPISLYNRLRENELEIALIESKKDIEDGKIIEESVEEHIRRITVE